MPKLYHNTWHKRGWFIRCYVFCVLGAPPCVTRSLATCPGVHEKANKGIDEKVFVEVSGGQVEVSERVLIGDSHVHQSAKGKGRETGYHDQPVSQVIDKRASVRTHLPKKRQETTRITKRECSVSRRFSTFLYFLPPKHSTVGYSSRQFATVDVFTARSLERIVPCGCLPPPSGEAAQVTILS